ncbi:chemotaxis-specific protein-glutamate methyltransferase CheB [Massilia terrae]|uniref:Protein-glutamate methylesterase/protein-glutamine glutaminase n=1 Tax=Massilia terrae TaxID=1811224 RepID=A0ABT2CSC2_9BURK|nr:chemotaxis protein CheB [Massilia terrae]MCS0656878.1 response regulator [Massilia terrae]
MTTVLVVDDSSSVRALLVHILGEAPGLQVIGVANDGEEAVRMAHELAPDVITMDLHMPRMDGYEAIRRIMQSCPTRIVVVSGGEDRAEVDASFRAIEAGALVLVRRPYGPGNPAHESTAAALVRTVRAMAEVRVVRRWADTRRPEARKLGAQRRLVAIGASTGGPTVLRDILAELPPGFPLPVVIVQHLAPGFTQGLADWLSGASGYPVEVLQEGTPLAAGRAYVVPDGRQPALGPGPSCKLLHAPPEHGMCPSVSHLFRAIDPELRAATAAVLLTGMGKDGAAELKQLREQGALTIAQDRASSVIYGMPGEAVRLDAAMLVLQPSEIGKLLARLPTEPFPSPVSQI